jgi:hypothetical protein
MGRSELGKLGAKQMSADMSANWTFGDSRHLAIYSRSTGNPEVIGSTVRFVPTNAQAVADRLLARSRQSLPMRPSHSGNASEVVVEPAALGRSVDLRPQARSRPTSAPFSESFAATRSPDRNRKPFLHPPEK